MSQDSPATVAGTDARPNRRAMREVLRRAVEIDGVINLDVDGFNVLRELAEVGAEDRDTPDSWAPVNRRSMRDDVDRFRNERMPVPAGLFDSLELVALALEYYEYATEVATRTATAFAALTLETDQIRDRCIQAIMSPAAADFVGSGRVATLDADAMLIGATGGRYSKTITGAKELADLAPFMVAHLEERAQLATKKAEAEKELGVARRRHATAITFAQAHTFAGADSVRDLAAAIPDVSAGDSEGGTLKETR